MTRVVVLRGREMLRVTIVTRSGWCEVVVIRCTYVIVAHV